MDIHIIPSHYSFNIITNKLEETVKNVNKENEAKEDKVVPLTAFTAIEETEINIPTNNTTTTTNNTDDKKDPVLNISNLANELHMTQEKVIELEKTKERIMRRLSKRKEESEGSEIEERLKQKSEVKRDYHRKSEWILGIAMRLQEQIINPMNEKEDLSLSLINEEKREILTDTYTKIIMDKPLNGKRSRKFTKTDFVLHNNV